jgi:hypothetical protein
MDLLTEEGRQARIDYWLADWPEPLTREEAEQTADSEVIDEIIGEIGDLVYSLRETQLSDWRKTLMTVLGDLRGAVAAMESGADAPPTDSPERA